MSLQNVNGPTGSPGPTIDFAMEEVASAAPHFQVGGQPPPLVSSLDQRMIEIRPADALSQLVKRSLEQSDTSVVQAGKRAIPDLTDKVLAVQNLLSRSEHYVRINRLQEAADALLEAQRLASQLPDPFAQANLLEKLDRAWVEALVMGTKNPHIAHLLLQKDWIRKAFEEALLILSAKSLQKKPPTCFICFDVESDTKLWLEKSFVPDLDKVGIAPLFCFRQFGPGKLLNRFQSLSRFADSVVIICTPELKKKCVGRVDNPTGCAMEIYLAKGRSADKAKWENIYPVCLKGSYSDLCPDPYLESHLPVSFTNFGNCTPFKLYSYYADALALFGKIRAIDGGALQNVMQAFFGEVQKILGKSNLDEEAIRQWREEAPIRSRAAQAVAARVIEEALKHPLVAKDCLRLAPAHPLFAGRSLLLDQLSRDFKLEVWESHNPTRMCVLHGPGGIGKTELAITFGNLHLASFSLIWFFRAETPELFEADYRDLAEVLGVDLNKKDAFEDVQRKVHIALENEAGQSFRPWLLILDNVAARIKIPERGGYVMATSQTKNIWSYSNDFVEVPPFSAQDTEALFQKMRYPLSKTDAEILVEHMEGFPVLLEQIGQYLKKTPSHSLLQDMHAIQKDTLVWQSREDGRNPKSLGKLFEATLARLEGQNRKAFAFIQFCAFLKPNRISAHLLDFWVENKGLSTKDRREILECLNDFLLLRYDSQSHTYSFSHLLQLVVQRLDTTGEAYRSSFDTLAKWTAKCGNNVIEIWQIGGS